MTLPYSLTRTVVIRAQPDTVFRFFTESDRWAAWWGAGSTIDARPGGPMKIRYANGVEASGEVVEVVAPSRVVFTMGYASGAPMPPGSSRVTIRLEAHQDGTRLNLLHEFAEAAPRDHHVQGWRYQLSVFSNVVTNEANAGAEARVDRWFSLWSDLDAASRERTLLEIATGEVAFRDPYSTVDGVDDLVPHIGASQKFMPGVVLHRDGAVRHCQGTVLVDWVCRLPDGREPARGSNVFRLAPDGRIAAVTGFWR
jgi:uncharacterized protein YndB with AHSA1/START domain